MEAFLKVLFYFFHERVWHKIKFGKKEIKPFVLWFTGLPGSGKTTIADGVYKYLKKYGLKVERLDSKDVRSKFKELGFTKGEVNFHIQRLGHLASTLEKNGIIVVASFVSPYKESRDFIKNLCHNFIEIYTKTPVDVSRQRYEANIHNQISPDKAKHFPEEIISVYEEPDKSQILLDTENESIEYNTKQVINYLKRYL